MHEDFQLPVTYKNEELTLPARLMHYGYGFRIEVMIGETKVLFERDEERSWRAIMNYEDVQADRKVNPELLKAVATAIVTLL